MTPTLFTFQTPDHLYQEFMSITSKTDHSKESTKIHPDEKTKKMQRTTSLRHIDLPPNKASLTLLKLNEIIDKIELCLKRTNCLRDQASIETLLLLSNKIKSSLSDITGKSGPEKQKIDLKTTKEKIGTLIKLLKVCKKKGIKLLEKHPNYFLKCPHNIASESHPLCASFRSFIREFRVPYVGKTNLPRILELYFNNVLIQSASRKSKKEKEGIDSLDLLQHALEDSPINTFTTINEFTPLNQELATFWKRRLMSGELIHSFINTPSETTNQSKEFISKSIWDNKDHLFNAILDNIPDVQISTSTPSPLQAKSSLYNNYGLKLDDSPKIEQDQTLSLKVRNTLYKTPTHKSTIRSTSQLKLLYNPETRQLFPASGPMTMCDAISLTQTSPNKPFIATLCDGCGLGESSKQAADTAAVKSLHYTEKNIAKAPSLRAIADIQVKSLLRAHEKIVQSASNEQSSGTTTILHLAITDGFLVATSLGDCKLFLIRSPSDPVARECIDLTANSRDSSIDAGDPGGRLGTDLVYNGQLIPQLNNLSVHLAAISPNEILIAASDGLGDILDPMILNESPRNFGLAEDRWDNSLPSHIEARKKAAEMKILEIINDKHNVEEISQALDNYASEKVEKYLLNLICSTGKNKFNMSRDEFPGKPDHKAHIVIKLDPSEDSF